MGVRIMSEELGRLDQTHQRRHPLAAARRSGVEPILADESPWPDLLLGVVVIDRDGTIIKVTRQCRPPFQTVFIGC